MNTIYIDLENYEEMMAKIRDVVMTRLPRFWMGEQDPEIWVNADGLKFMIKEMNDSYIISCIYFLEKRERDKLSADDFPFNDMPAQYYTLVNEAIKRGLKYA